MKTLHLNVLQQSYGRDGVHEPLLNKEPSLYIAKCDLFENQINYYSIDRVLAIIANCPHHKFMLCTKHASEMAVYFENLTLPAIEQETYFLWSENKVGKEANERNFALPLENLWVGVSLESVAMANELVPILLACPQIKNRFVFCGDLMEDLDLTNIFIESHELGHTYIDALMGRKWTYHRTLGYTDSAVNKIDLVTTRLQKGRPTKLLNPVIFSVLEYYCLLKDTPFNVLPA